WYLEGIPGLGTKDAAQALSGFWLVELPELQGLKEASLARVKEWTTLRTDTFRPAYGRQVVKRPRQTVFLGTTNELKYLTDVTGNRRYWPVQTGCIDRDGLRRDRDQLWAEAVLTYQAGTPWWPTADETVQLADLQESRFREDMWENAILDYVAEKQAVTSLEVLQALGMTIAQGTRGVQMRIADVMRRHGWTQHRAGHENARVWRRGHQQGGLF